MKANEDKILQSDVVDIGANFPAGIAPILHDVLLSFLCTSSKSHIQRVIAATLTAIKRWTDFATCRANLPRSGVRKSLIRI
jgi:hypothetical protein